MNKQIDRETYEKIQDIMHYCNSWDEGAKDILKLLDHEPPCKTRLLVDPTKWIEDSYSDHGQLRLMLMGLSRTDVDFIMGSPALVEAFLPLWKRANKSSWTAAELWDLMKPIAQALKDMGVILE